jgi:NAD(P)-dependent dehydrogenase (short-subunit alcohol dehydrogenase family)
MAMAPFETVKRDEWDWVIGVNLYGVINGASTFLPRLRRHGQGGHIVNTASMAGIMVNKARKNSAYATTKFGVVALSEALRHELEGSSIGVSVLCPAAVNTGIYASSLVRPERFGGPYRREGGFSTKADLEKGLAPDAIGDRVVQAIRDEEFFILTHSWGRANLQRRHDELMAAFDKAEQFERDLAKRGA